MKQLRVRDYMVAISDYATVSVNATLAEAIFALETAQQAFNKNNYQHRAILVFDDNKRIVGRISQIDIIRSLEPKYDELKAKSDLSRFGISPNFMESALTSYSLWDRPFSYLCEKAASRHVREIMHSPTEGEYIQGDASLEEAVHMIIVHGRHSLLVTENNKIIGILRLADVFKMICEGVKECKI